MPPRSRVVQAVLLIITTALVGALLFFAAGLLAWRIPATRPAVHHVNQALPWFLLVLALVGIWMKIGYRWLLPLLGLSGAFVVYLAWDDLHWPPAPEFGPVVPANSKSFAAYRWLLRDDPKNRLKEVPSNLSAFDPLPTDREAWPTFAQEHHKAIVTAWNEDTLFRAWVDGMAAAEPEGLYPSAGVNDPMLAFAPVRRGARIRWAYAYTLMRDKRADEAAKILLQFVRANYHLQRAGSVLVTEMISVVCLKGSYEQLDELVTSHLISAPVKAEIAALLRQAPPIPLVIHNAFLGERVFGRDAIERAARNSPDLMAATVLLENEPELPPNRFVTRIFFNPHRTAREYDAFLKETSRAAEAHELPPAPPSSSETPVHTWQIKNPAGQQMVELSKDAFAKIAKAFWKLHDQRAALLRRLEP